MTKINLSCAGANLLAQVHGEITAGMRGIAVEISFDEAWQGLTPVLVVECADMFRKMAVDAAGRSSIPWECCISGEKLKVGVCGLNADGTVKLPTVWASCGRVLPSADDVQAEESSAPPTPTLLEQITALANQAQAAAHAVTEAAQRGDFNGAVPEFSVGTVTTLPAASPAAASVTGTVLNPILNLGIPAGKDGVPPNIQVGTVTTVPSGTPAAVHRRGTDESPVFDFDIPMGAAGLKGADAVIDPTLELRIKKLEAAAEGNLYLFWEDAAEGSSKTVPDGVMRFAALDAIGGKTVVRNQLFAVNNTTTGGVTIKNTDTGVVLNGTNTVQSARYSTMMNAAEGHVYYSAYYGTAVDKMQRIIGSYGSFRPVNAGVAAAVHKCSASRQGTFTQVYCDIGTEFKNDTFGGIIIDLTQWFGAEIADTITTPEQAFALGVPRDSLPYDEGTLVSADVECVDTGIGTKSVPAEIRSLPGYGWSAGSVYNEVDYARKQYIQRVGSVDLGTLKDWEYNPTPQTFTAAIPDAVKSASNSAITSKWLCSKYEQFAYYSIINGEQKGFAIRDYTEDDKGVVIGDVEYGTSVSALKQALSGVYLNYELAEPIVTDISELLPTGFENIEVEAGSRITFRQAGGLELPVPNQETYMIKLGGGNA